MITVGHHLLPFMLLWFWNPSFAQTILVPGCPSIDNITADDWLKDISRCFCESIPEEESGIRLICLYANISDIISAFKRVKAASVPILELHGSSLELGEEGITQDLFQDDIWQLRRIILKTCENQLELRFHPESLSSIRHSLEHIKISDCRLPRIPEAFRKLDQLRRLEVTSAELELLGAFDFDGMGSLEYLDLAENRLEVIEPLAFQGLSQLKTLILGPRNGFNLTIFTEINRIQSLERLEMAQMRLPRIPNGALSNLKNLRHLNLLKNDFDSLAEGSFEGLESLESLDLRVNLLQKLEPGVFQPLRSLTRLKLAGNYISDIKESVFDDLAQLKTLDLSWNELKTLEGQPFRRLEMLENLDLHHNLNLSFIHRQFFTGLSHVKLLNLSQTAIVTISPSCLYPLMELGHLDLSDNRHLRALDAKTFVENRRLTHLWLNSMSISNLDGVIFDSLALLQYVDLSNNPWLCDDQLSSFISRIQKMQENDPPLVLGNGGDTVCSEPEELRGLSLLMLDPSSLKPYRPPTTATITNYDSTTTPGEDDINTLSPTSVEDFTDVPSMETTQKQKGSIGSLISSFIKLLIASLRHIFS